MVVVGGRMFCIPVFGVCLGPYIWRANSHPNCDYLLTVMILKKQTTKKQHVRSPSRAFQMASTHLKLQTNFSAWIWCCHYWQRLLLLRRKWTLARTDTIPRTTEDHIVFKKVWIHTSRHIMINTDGEEETGKSWMGRGHCVTIQFLPMTCTLMKRLATRQLRPHYILTQWNMFHFTSPVYLRGKLQSV